MATYRRRLRAPAGAHQPHGHLGLLAHPSNGRLQVRRVLGLLAESAQVRRALPVGGRIDHRHHEPLVRERLPRANEEIAGAPGERAVGKDLQPAVPTREQDDGGLGIGWRQHEHSLRHAGAGGNVHHLLRGLRLGRAKCGQRHQEASDPVTGSAVHRRSPGNCIHHLRGPRRSGRRLSKTSGARRTSGEVEAIEVHHLVPGRDEVAGRTSPARRSFRRPRPARGAASSSRRRGRRACRSTSVRPSCDRGLRTRLGVGDGRLPLRAHVEQVHEEVVGQRSRAAW